MTFFFALLRQSSASGKFSLEISQESRRREADGPICHNVVSESQLLWWITDVDQNSSACDRDPLLNWNPLKSKS